MNFLTEVLGFLLYICVLFPIYIVCTLFFMMLCIITLPLKITAIKGIVTNYLKQKK